MVDKPDAPNYKVQDLKCCLTCRSVDMDDAGWYCNRFSTRFLNPSSIIDFVDELAICDDYEHE